MPMCTRRLYLPALSLIAVLATSLACSFSPPGPATPPPVEAELPTPTVALPVPTDTSAPPTEAPAVLPPGWLTYHNDMLGYEFDYPGEALLSTNGVTGYPTEELPPGVEPGQYFATLEATYTEALCVGVTYGTAYLYIGAPDDLGGRYATPCGLSGVGAYDLEDAEEPVTIGSDLLTATGSRVYSVEDHTFLYEFLFTRLSDFRFNYGGDWTQAGTTYDAYLLDKAVILQVLESWRWIG